MVPNLYCNANPSIRYRENSEMSQNDAVMYGSAMFVITIVSGIALLHYFFFGFYYGMKVRIAVCSLIYRKVCTEFVHSNTFTCEWLTNCKKQKFEFFASVSSVVTKSFKRYSAGETGQSIIKRCESLRYSVSCYASIVDVTDNDNHSGIHIMDRDSLGWYDWHGDCLSHCANSK